MSVGTNVNVGFVVSMTVTDWSAVAVRLFVSLTVQVTVFGPTANCAGALFVFVTGPPSHTSTPLAMPMP